MTQREIGVDTPKFSEGLRRALRQDPDVILIGEMRDLETIETAIHAAETGHLVFGTLHTTGAAETVNRVIDQFPTDQQEQVRVMLSTTLICVISQALIPKASGKGVVAAFEIMIMTPAIQNLIRVKKTYQIDSEIQTGSRHGMVYLDDHLLKLMLKGIISPQEGLARSRKPEDVEKRLEQGRPPEEEQKEREAAKAPAEGQRPAAAPAAAGRRPVLQINTMRGKKK
jgi:twitching motility protein PilT